MRITGGSHGPEESAGERRSLVVGAAVVHGVVRLKRVAQLAQDDALLVVESS